VAFVQTVPARRTRRAISCLKSARA